MDLTAEQLARLRRLSRAGDYEIRNMLSAYDAGDRDDALVTVLLDELEG